jgi:glycosyltransferase involved in cell wall biosynthesis
MRVGLNLMWLVPGYRGLESYARGLVSGLVRCDRGYRYVLFTNPRNHASFAHLPVQFSRRLCPLPFESRVTWRLVEQFLLPSYVARENLDLLHSPADLLPVRVRCPAVVTIHDINFFSLSDRLPTTASRLLAGWVKRSARQANAIITVSEFSRAQILADLGPAPERIAVVPNAPVPRLRSSSGWAPLRRQLGITTPYLLTFADGSPHKNLNTLLRALPLAAARLPLVVVGERQRQDSQVLALLDDLGEQTPVIFTGYLADDALALVLARACLLVFPSLYEGFGLPVLEAMAAGVAVACARAGALPEVAGSAAYYFDPRDPADIAGAIDQLLRDEPARRALVAAGQRHCTRFSWERTARLTTEVYESAVGLDAAMRLNANGNGTRAHG